MRRSLSEGVVSEEQRLQADDQRQEYAEDNDRSDIQSQVGPNARSPPVPCRSSATALEESTQPTTQDEQHCSGRTTWSRACEPADLRNGLDATDFESEQHNSEHRRQRHS
ncbi:hypothetical protein C8039_00050 [Halogeometricum sp. wsp3]|nr:hypothetical protein C8039_00050 [Halogeometricum sp. wsp3]